MDNNVGLLLLYLLCSLAIMAAMYLLLWHKGPFFRSGRPLSKTETLLCRFIMLYPPAQLVIMLAAGKHLVSADTLGNEGIAFSFAIAHAIMAVMGMVTGRYFYKKQRSALLLIALNGVTATFYFLSAIIFFSALMVSS